MAVSTGSPHEGTAELTFSSTRTYDDPLADIEVDVVFTGDSAAWRVPAFWRGGRRWSVRFTPPDSGRYRYSVESTDPRDNGLNGLTGAVDIRRYSGPNQLLEHGPLRVSENRRSFEHVDGTPFFWLGDSWYSGLSTRLSWAGFKRLTKDRATKGYTVVELCAGLPVTNEEDAPQDPPFRNEGGLVWGTEFEQLNPRFFDYADRRIQHLIDKGIVPAIIGGWWQVLAQMGIEKMKRHWRYVVARYGAYPVFWIVGGELYDPAPGERQPEIATDERFVVGGWTEIARYVREIDPYGHPLTAHELPPPSDSSVADESLTDFDLLQPSHLEWTSMSTMIAQLNMHYSRTHMVKPIVVGEIGYEGFGAAHYENFQRAAFWLAMLNGAAGFSYGTVEIASCLTSDKPWARVKLSFLTWQEAMQFPGSRQVGLGAQLLRRYPWWEVVPHPEWVTPAGTTLLEPHDQTSGFDIAVLDVSMGGIPGDGNPPNERAGGAWTEVAGKWRLPYAAGISRSLRLIYLPYLGLGRPTPVVTVVGLEPDCVYRAYYWQPAIGARIDLGLVTCRSDGSGTVSTSRNNRQVTDAAGGSRGELGGTHWEDYGANQKVEDFAYLPEGPPTLEDWVLVLEAAPSEDP
jgi:hypothetical protein